MPAVEPQPRDPTIRFDPTNVWRVGFVVIALVAVALFLRFVISDAGSVIFTLLMAWFAALAMEPAVGPLSRRMRRGAAVGLVMGALALFTVIFIVAFGQLFVEQVAQLLKALPGVVDGVVAWVNDRLNTRYNVNDIISQLNIQPSQVAQYAGQIVGGCSDSWAPWSAGSSRCSPSPCSPSTSRPTVPGSAATWRRSSRPEPRTRPSTCGT